MEPVRTDRLCLYAAAVDQAGELFPIFSDPAGWWYDPLGVHTDVARTRAWLASAATRWNTDGLSYWLARRADTGEAVGVGGVQRRPSRSWNLFYRIATPHWGHGYATELAVAAIVAAHDADNDVSVGAWIVADNRPSIGVAERIGLVNYGPMVDIYDGETRLVYADRPPTERLPPAG